MERSEQAGNVLHSPHSSDMLHSNTGQRYSLQMCTATARAGAQCTPRPRVVMPQPRMLPSPGFLSARENATLAGTAATCRLLVAATVPRTTEGSRAAAEEEGSRAVEEEDFRAGPIACSQTADWIHGQVTPAVGSTCSEHLRGGCHAEWVSAQTYARLRVACVCVAHADGGIMGLQDDH